MITIDIGNEVISSTTRYESNKEVIFVENQETLPLLLFIASVCNFVRVLRISIHQDPFIQISSYISIETHVQSDSEYTRLSSSWKAARPHTDHLAASCRLAVCGAQHVSRQALLLGSHWRTGVPIITTRSRFVRVILISILVTWNTWKRREMHVKSLSWNPKQKFHVGDFGTVKNIILKNTFDKQGRKEGAAFTLRRAGWECGLLWIL
jgi:hypothetical protein